MPTLCEKLVANTTLKCLDISMNALKAKGINLLAAALRENTSLEFLGVGSMKLTIEDLRPLLLEFGKKKLTAEEAVALEAKIKERDTIVEKNKKLKGKKEEPVPKVNPLLSDDQGNKFEVKKESFKFLNIGLNQLDDSAFNDLEQLLARTPTHFCVLIASKAMSKDIAKLLSSKFGSRIPA
jgi:hypothetical protein